MAEQIDKEIEAIKTVLHALEPLQGDVRASVLQYVVQRLQIVLAPSGQNPLVASFAALPDVTKTKPEATGEPVAMPSHIKQFKEQKKPRSANEMAALVAF